MQDDPPTSPRRSTAASASAPGRIMTRLLLFGIALFCVIFGEVQWAQGAGILQSLGPWFLLIGCLVFLGEIAFRAWKYRSWPLYRASSEVVSKALGKQSKWTSLRENTLLTSAAANAPAPPTPTPELPSRSDLSAAQRKQRYQMGLHLLLFIFGLLLGLLPLFMGARAQQQYFEIVRYQARSEEHT